MINPQVRETIYALWVVVRSISKFGWRWTAARYWRRAWQRRMHEHPCPGDGALPRDLEEAIAAATPEQLRDALTYAALLLENGMLDRKGAGRVAREELTKIQWILESTRHEEYAR